MQNVEEKKKEKIAEMSLSLWARHVEGEEIQLTALHVDLVANTFTSKNSIIEIISKTWGNILLYIYHDIDLVNTFKSKNSNIEIISKIKKGKILNEIFSDRTGRRIVGLEILGSIKMMT